MKWIIDRLKEASTWQGVIVAATGLGVKISPAAQSAIVTAGAAVFVLLSVFIAEKKS